MSKGAAATAPLIISVVEPALALSLEIAIRAHGIDTVIHVSAGAISSMRLDPYSTVIVDGHVLPADPVPFLDELRRQNWRGRLLVLTEDTPGPAFKRLCADGAVLIEKPFGSAQLIAEIERA